MNIKNFSVLLTVFSAGCAGYIKSDFFVEQFYQGCEEKQNTKNLIKKIVAIATAIYATYSIMRASSEKEMFLQSKKWLIFSLCSVILFIIKSLHHNAKELKYHEEKESDSLSKRLNEIEKTMPPLRSNIKQLLEENAAINKLNDQNIKSDQEKAVAYALGQFEKANENTDTRQVQLNFIIEVLRNKTLSKDLEERLTQSISNIGDTTKIEEDWKEFPEKQPNNSTLRDYAIMIRNYIRNKYVRAALFEDAKFSKKNK